MYNFVFVLFVCLFCRSIQLFSFRDSHVLERGLLCQVSTVCVCGGGEAGSAGGGDLLFHLLLRSRYSVSVLMINHLVHALKKLPS